jgi:hypothetical protein
MYMGICGKMGGLKVKRENFGDKRGKRGPVAFS